MSERNIMARIVKIHTEVGYTVAINFCLIWLQLFAKREESIYGVKSADGEAVRFGAASVVFAAVRCTAG